MDIENLLNDFDQGELTTFLTHIIPIIPFGEIEEGIIEEQIDLKNIDEKISVGPVSYLDLSCVEVANYLNSKNIYSIASLKTNNYIYLFLDKLDNENMKVFKEKQRENSDNFFMSLKNPEFFGICVLLHSTLEETSKEFLELVQDFKMQDVQRGYYNEKNFLMNICDCEKVEGLKEFRTNQAQIVFDVNKMDKSFRDYLKESGYENYYLQDEHRVYLNDFYFNAHKNYLNETKT